MNKYAVNEKAGESSEGNNQGAAIENNCEGRDSREMLSGLFVSKVVPVPMWGIGCSVGQRSKVRPVSWLLE